MFRLSLIVLLVLVAIGVAYAVDYFVFRKRRNMQALHGSRLERLVETINERAWAERDVSPVLSAALIERIRAAHQGDSSTSAAHLIDELREIAWAHRESDPHLSVIVLDMIARDGHKHLE